MELRRRGSGRGPILPQDQPLVFQVRGAGVLERKGVHPGLVHERVFKLDALDGALILGVVSESGD